jgi:hypothetical protein
VVARFARELDARMASFLVQREIVDLPPIPYHAVHLPGRGQDRRVAGLLEAIRARLSPK